MSFIKGKLFQRLFGSASRKVLTYTAGALGGSAFPILGVLAEAIATYTSDLEKGLIAGGLVGVSGMWSFAQKRVDVSEIENGND
jgi:hypothetical protein